MMMMVGTIVCKIGKMKPKKGCVWNGTRQLAFDGGIVDMYQKWKCKSSKNRANVQDHETNASKEG